MVILSFILLYAGLFLFGGGGDSRDYPPPGDQEQVITGEEAAGTSSESYEDAVRYFHRSETVNGLKQEINILEIDPGAPGVKIRPVLSHDLIYGFELLSSMAARKNAYAAVNGGFFRDFGLPSGMVVIDGELFSASTGKYPVFIVEDGSASLREIGSRIIIEVETAGGSTVEIPADNINFPAGGRQTAVYTPAYGRYNRAGAKNITVTVEKGVVTKVADYAGEAGIPEDGMLITFFDVQKYAGIELPVKAGDKARLVHKPDMTETAAAYECGSWLVKDGISVVKEKDAWVGVLTNRDPRTAVGIKEDGTVLLLTVDGRQPGYSAGFTGRELADYLIGCGVKDAAMLDGGASTEMLLEGRLVSRPSYKGQEREVAGGILVLLEQAG